MVRKYLIGVFVCLIGCSTSKVFATDGVINLYGRIKDVDSKEIIRNELLIVEVNGVVQTDCLKQCLNGYRLQLKLGFVYDIKFSAFGYLHKIIRIDAENILPEYQWGGFDMNVDGYLIKYCPAFDTTILDLPVAICKFHEITNGFEFDFEYSECRATLITKEIARIKNMCMTEAAVEMHDEVSSDNEVAEAEHDVEVISDSSSIRIFPNPNKGTFRLILDNESLDAGAEISISDLSGRLMYNSKLTNEHQQVEMPDAVPGVYMLRVKGSNAVHTIRFIVE